MKNRDYWESKINQASYDSEVGDFVNMNLLIDEIMALQESRPTPPTLDAGESAVSTSSSHASAESTSQTLPKRTQRR